MQIKHTFLFTLILSLAWTVYVFAYATGPDPGVNGLFGQDCTSCHTSFKLNSGSGSVSISGLPASWTPGQTYALTVTVNKVATSRVYGFQLSAVVDSNNQQAGTLASGSGLVQVICGDASNSVLYPGIKPCPSPGTIQYAEHTLAGPSNTFAVNWTAPSSASVGTVRFNVAGNAANGDGTSFGDFIYTSVTKVSPGSAPDLSTHAFMIVDRGGMSIITDGSGAQTAGYSGILPGSGSSTPTGVAIFGYRNANNTLVSETGVPAVPLLTSGRIYAEINTPLDTGVAIANPNASPATINFSYTDATGATVGSGSTTIPPNTQTAKFLDQSPYNVYPGAATGASFQGTFSFTSSGAPVGVVALRGLTNERSDFLMSTLPVIDTTAAPGTGSIVIPHFADGAPGWTTKILLVNPTDNTISGTVQFTDPSGAATKVTIGGTTSSSFPYSIPGRSSQKLATAGTAGTASTPATGSVTVIPAGGGTTPVALVVFTLRVAGFTVSEAGVPVTSGTAFRLYVESAGTSGQPGNIQSGIAVANTASSEAPIIFDITDLNGSPVPGISPVILTLQPFAQTATFLAGIFQSQSLPNPFKGVLRITTTGSGISVAGLRGRYNERQPIPDFLITTTSPSNEGAPAASGEFLFPQVVNGGGYTTQFILFSGTGGQSASGNLRFFKPDGTPFNLNVN